MRVVGLLYYLLAIALPTAAPAGPVQAARITDDAPVVSTTTGEFDGLDFSCVSYTAGPSIDAITGTPSLSARTWVLGYLAGFYKKEGKLELSDVAADGDKLDDVIRARCTDYPRSTIRAVALHAVVKDIYKMPATVADLSFADYTCSDYADARPGSGEDAARADLAELWAFAFVQGYKNATISDIVIPIENKPTVTKALIRFCRTNRDMTFLNMTTVLAERVRLQ